MTPNNISFPVNLGTSQWGTASYGQLIYVYDGNNGCWMACNYSGGGFNSGYPCTTYFTLWWVGAGQFALQIANNQWNCYANNVGLYAAFPSGLPNWQVTDSNITQYSTFGLENLGGGNVAITKFAGAYLNGSQPFGGWNWNVFMYQTNPVPPDPSTIFNPGGPQFNILLVSGSGLGLNLTGQDFAAGGYIHSISNTDFTGTNLTNANLSTLPDLSVASCKFNGATLTGAILTGVKDLNKATWTSAILANTELSHVDPKGVTGVDFSTVNLTAAKLSNGNALGANFSYAGANFSQANLSRAVLDHIGFAGATFSNATLAGANLTGADLSNADLTNADLTGAILAGTNLTGATLSGTKFDQCDLSTTTFGPAPKFGNSAGTRTSFKSATVPAGSLGSNWSWLDLTGATMTAIPTSIPSLIADQALLPDQLNLQNVDFSGGSGASFKGTRMFGAQLQGANLQGAAMLGALLKSAELNGANLTLANLTGAYLIEKSATPKTPIDELEAACLIGAFMFNTVLDQAHCDGVDFSDTTFSTSLLSSTQRASAVGAFMNDTKFNSAWADQAVFNGAQMSGANLASSSLVGASFQNEGSTATQLTPSQRAGGADASINSADVRGTNFTGAAMSGIDMAGIKTSPPNGSFEKTFKGYKGAQVMVGFNFGPTVMGNTARREREGG